MGTGQAAFKTKYKLSRNKTEITFFLSFLTWTNWERKQLVSANCTVLVFRSIKGYFWLSYLVQLLLYCWDLCEKVCPLGFNVGQSCTQCSCVYFLKPEELVPSTQDRRFLWWFSIHFFWKLLQAEPFFVEIIRYFFILLEVSEPQKAKNILLSL